MQMRHYYFDLEIKGSIRKMMNVLRKYELVSGQLINLSKIYVYLHEKVPTAVCHNIKRIIRIAQGTFPFTYLKCPIFYGRKTKPHFEELVKKVAKRVLGWQNMLLTYGGRYVLIAHILQSMPIYLMSAINPPKRVINQIHKILAKFF